MRKCALVVALVLWACGDEKPRPLTQTELRLIVTAASLTEWGMENLDARAQKIDTRHDLDGSMTISCEYDSEKVPNAKQPLFFISNTQIFSSEIGTDTEFTKLIDAYKTGIGRVPGRYFKEKQELLTSGDQHYAAFMQNGGNIIGNVFVVRRGRVIHSLLVSRVYFDDPKDVERLFAPMFRASDEYLR